MAGHLSLFLSVAQGTAAPGTLATYYGEEHETAYVRLMSGVR